MNRPKAASKSKGAIAKEVLTDQGVNYNAADTLLFAASTNLWGIAMCLTALGVSALSKGLAVSDTNIVKKDSWLGKTLLDPKTPLMTNAATLAVIGAVAVASGSWIPAAVSLLWIITDYRLAQSIENAKREKEKTAQNGEKQEKPGFRRTLSLLFKRPDMYLYGGNAVAGLLAGGAAIWMFPVIAFAGAIAFKNAVQNKPEHKWHPKIVFAIVDAGIAGIGIASGNWLPALAHVMYGGVMLKTECDITPGGGRQILRDVKGGFARLLGGKKEELAPSPSLAPVPLSGKPDTGTTGVSADFSARNKPPGPLAKGAGKTSVPVPSGMHP
ncbi:MAG: hypothetical protein V1721_09385 [Pseudomonadota bacterium]